MQTFSSSIFADSPCNQPGDGILILTAYSGNYAPGAVCEAANRAKLGRRRYLYIVDIWCRHSYSPVAALRILEVCIQDRIGQIDRQTDRQTDRQIYRSIERTNCHVRRGCLIRVTQEINNALQPVSLAAPARMIYGRHFIFSRSEHIVCQRDNGRTVQCRNQANFLCLFPSKFV